MIRPNLSAEDCSFELKVTLEYLTGSTIVDGKSDVAVAYDLLSGLFPRMKALHAKFHHRPVTKRRRMSSGSVCMKERLVSRV